METVTSIKQPKITDKNFIAKFTREDGKVCYRANLFDQVGEIENYVPLLHVLNTAKPGEIVEIMINSPGGFVTTGVRIMQAIYNCKADVYTVGVGPCMSIAACIWGAGKYRKMMEPLGSLMIHMPSSQIGGKTLDIAQECHSTNAYFSGVIRLLFKDILTEEEMSEVIDQRKDKYFNAKYVNEKLGGVK